MLPARLLIISSGGKFLKTKKNLELLYPLILILTVLLIWGIVSLLGLIPKFILPSPYDVANAFINDFSNLMQNLLTTLYEAFSGLLISLVLAFLFSFLMDRFKIFYKMLYPVLIITQTIPVIAIAPLLVLWLGYGIVPKIVLVVIMCFFPITVSLYDGIRSTDPDAVNLLRAMGASKLQIFKYVKLPNSMNSFFSGLSIAVCYSVVGAVISEWIGGYSGLGVYMTRVRKSYAFDKMFAAIFLVSLVSVIFVMILKHIKKLSMPWVNTEEDI